MLKVALWGIRCLPRIFKDYFSWIRKYAVYPDDYPLEERYAKVRSLVIHILDKIGVDLRVENLNYIREQKDKFLIVANHLSVFDVIVMIAISEKPISFVGKAELITTPFVGKIMRCIQSCFIDRGNLRQNAEVLNKVEDRLEKNYLSYVIYPEGTRQKHPRQDMLPMHPGSFKIAGKSKVNLIPMAEYGTWRPLGVRSFFKSYLIQMRFLTPIEPKEFLEVGAAEVQAKVQADLQKNINELRAIDDRWEIEKGYLNKPSKDYLKKALA